MLLRLLSGLLAVYAVTACARTQIRDIRDWYTGDLRCAHPLNDGTYAAPYRAQDHPHEYPTFSDADTPGWSCSYQREDGVTVQFGDSRSPRQQWLDLWGGRLDQSTR